MAVHYSLPERRNIIHHEEMVKRLISNQEARNRLNTYIYRQDLEEKERICQILHEWDKPEYSTEPSGQVINKDAVPHIKDWCSNSSGKNLITVKKFLKHLTNEQDKEEEEASHGERTQRGNTGSRRNSLLSDRNGRPSLQKRETITNGSFYPSSFEGRGNNTGMFNIVKPVQQPNFNNTKSAGKRPTTSESQVSRKMSGMKRTLTQPAMSRHTEYYEIPTNRSGVFGEVINPVPQKENHQSPQSPQKRPPSNTSGMRGQWNRPSTMQNRPGTTQSRPDTMQSRPGTMVSQRSRIPVGLGRRAKTQGNMLRHREPSEKLKFSANLQNAREEEINEPGRNGTPVYADDGVTPRYPHNHHHQQQQQQQHHQQQQQQHYQNPATPENYQIDMSGVSPPPGNTLMDGESSHRPIQHPNKFPGRRYQASQIFL